MANSSGIPQHCMQATFKTTVDVGKLEVKEFLEKVYNLPVLRVDTAIIYGKKRNAEAGRARMLTKNSDFKKVWVKFAPGRLFPSLTPEKK
jgi:ribosomal protein L23